MRWFTARMATAAGATTAWRPSVRSFASWILHAALHQHIGMQAAALLSIERAFHGGSIVAIGALLWASSSTGHASHGPRQPPARSRSKRTNRRRATESAQRAPVGHMQSQQSVTASGRWLSVPARHRRAEREAPEVGNRAICMTIFVVRLRRPHGSSGVDERGRLRVAGRTNRLPMGLRAEVGAFWDNRRGYRHPDYGAAQTALHASNPLLLVVGSVRPPGIMCGTRRKAPLVRRPWFTGSAGGTYR